LLPRMTAAVERVAVAPPRVLFLVLLLPPLPRPLNAELDLAYFLCGGRAAHAPRGRGRVETGSGGTTGVGSGARQQRGKW